MTELASESSDASKQLATDDDPGSDPDLTGHEHEVLQVVSATEPALAERRQICLVVAVHRLQGPPEHVGDDLGQRDTLPFQQVGGAMENAVEVDQPWHADAESDHGEPGNFGLTPDETCGTDRPSQYDLGPEQPVVTHDRPAATDGTGEVDDATRHVVDVDFYAEPGRPLRVQTERAARSPDEAAFRVALDDKLGIHQCIDQCRDRRLGEASARSQLCTRQSPRRRDLPEHEREIVPLQQLLTSGHAGKWSSRVIRHSGKVAIAPRHGSRLSLACSCARDVLVADLGISSSYPRKRFGIESQRPA